MFIIEILTAIIALAGSIFMLMVAIRLYDVLGLVLEVLRALKPYSQIKDTLKAVREYCQRNTPGGHA